MKRQPRFVADHELKTHPGPFTETWRQQKRHEIRTADRDFKPWDSVFLREWDPATESYTGRRILTEITSVTKGGEWGLPPGLVVFSHREIVRGQDGENFP